MRLAFVFRLQSRKQLLLSRFLSPSHDPLLVIIPTVSNSPPNSTKVVLTFDQPADNLPFIESSFF